MQDLLVTVRFYDTRGKPRYRLPKYTNAQLGLSERVVEEQWQIAVLFRWRISASTIAGPSGISIEVRHSKNLASTFELSSNQDAKIRRADISPQFAEEAHWTRGGGRDGLFIRSMPKTHCRRDYESQTWNDNQAVQSHHVPKLTPVGTNICLGYDGDLEAQILLHVSLQGMGLLREMQKCWGGGLSRTLYHPKCHFCTCDMLVFPTMASDLLW